MADRDGAAVGLLLAELDRTDRGDVVLWLSLLAVAPSAQRSGVATALLGALTARYPQVSARVETDDVAALAALAVAGFIATGQERASDELMHLERAGP